MSGQDAYDTMRPAGIRSRRVDGVNGLGIHLWEAGFEPPQRPCVLLLHGFPELAFSWRKIMVPLAEAGYHVVAPDQRGFGRTTGWDPDYDGDLASFRFLNLVRDALGLVFALGHAQVAAVVGHDFGASVAAWGALVRPDVFRRLVIMSAPFSGAPAPASLRGPRCGPGRADVHARLADLDPPRRHYHRYYCTREANPDMLGCRQGVHAFLRAYFHMKSADWPGNRPHRLSAWTAEELVRLPAYYMMHRDRSMPATVADEMPDAGAIAGCRWLPDDELAVYAREFERTGFQGGLNWYRCRSDPGFEGELEVFAGRTVDVPSCFIAGAQDWGVHQSPGAFDAMTERACTRMHGRHLVDGAGHWVQQEQPRAVIRLLLEFLRHTTIEAP